MKSNPLNYYRYYNSAKLHFKDVNYDIQKYGLNRKRFSVEAYESDNARFFCERLAKDYITSNDFILLCNTNLFINPDIWINDLLSESARENYLWAKKYISRQDYYFLEDFNYLHSVYGSIAKFNVCTEVMNMKIHPETVILLSRMLPKFDQKLTKDASNFITETVIRRIRKYGVFVTVPDTSFYETTRQKMFDLICEPA